MATPSNASRVGVNLEGSFDSSRGRPFIDLCRQVRQPWSKADDPWASNLTNVDEHGWPLEDFVGLFLSSQVHIGGVYKLSFRGRAVTIQGMGSPATIGNVAYDPVTNRTTADVTMPDTATEVSLYLRFMGTSRNDGSGAAGLTEVKLLLPGYDSDANVFSDEFLASLAPFGHMRFMDAMHTNGSHVTTWASRPKVTDASWAVEGKGWPIEVCIDLARRTHKDAWICIPHQATDDYYENLAAYLKNTVPQGMHVYFEYSNEVWNFSFPQWSYNYYTAADEVAAGDTQLTMGGADVGDGNNWGWRRTAKKCLQLKLLLGLDDDRFRAVYATQMAWAPPGYQAARAFEYVQAYYGPVADHFWAVAVAPYFGPPFSFYSRNDLTADEIAEELYEVSNNTRPDESFLLGFRLFAASHGIKMCCYEAGLDLGQRGESFAAKVAAQYLERTGEAVGRNIDLFCSATPEQDPTGGVYTYFGLSGPNVVSGYWGLTDDIRDLDQPKYAQAAAAALRYPLGPPDSPDQVDTPLEICSTHLARALLDLTALNAQSARYTATIEQLNGQVRTLQGQVSLLTQAVADRDDRLRRIRDAANVP